MVLHVVLGAAVGQVVAGDAGHHDVLQAQADHGLGHAARLVGIRRLRPALGHAAKTAGPRTGVAQDHERGRLLGVAFHAIGTFRMIADGLQLQFIDQPGRKVIGVALGHVAFQPAGQRGRLGHGEGLGFEKQTSDRKMIGQIDIEFIFLSTSFCQYFDGSWVAWMTANCSEGLQGKNLRLCTTPAIRPRAPGGKRRRCGRERCRPAGW